MTSVQYSDHQVVVGYLGRPAEKGRVEALPKPCRLNQVLLSEATVPVYLASPNAAVVRADLLDFAIANALVCLHFDKFGSLEL